MYSLIRHLAVVAGATVLSIVLLTAAEASWFEAIQSSNQLASAELEASLNCTTSETDPDDLVVPASAAAPAPHAWALSAGAIYPGYVLTCSYSLTNSGSVPWNVESLILTLTPSAGAPVTAICAPGASCTIPDTYFTLTVSDVIGCQTHPAEAATGTFTISSTAAPVLPPGAYHVRASWQVNQWNESAYLTCGVLRP